MTRLGRFIVNIFSTFFNTLIVGEKAAFSIIIDWSSVALAHGFEIIMDIVSAGILTHTERIIDKVSTSTTMSDADKAELKDTVKAAGEAGMMVGQVGLSQTTGGIISSIIGPWLKLIEYNTNRHAKQQRFDPKTALAIKFRRGRPGRAAEAEVRRMMEGDLLDQGWSPARSDLLEDVAHTRLKEDLLCTLRYRKKIEEQDFLDRMYFLGYDFAEAEDYYKSMAAYPGISDIVRMAVREAYTPEIAERFGQYQDLPAEFITEAAKVGIPEEIAKQYWAAHWDLPSSGQGFEMFHRTTASPVDADSEPVKYKGEVAGYRVINEATLNLLLRALDVMPYWRKKLPQIAYNPFTRVDIRRMHKLGILNEKAVFRAYIDIGYDEAKAASLTEFTIKLNTETETQTEKDLLKSDILAAYRARLYSPEETATALKNLGYGETEAKLIVDSTKQNALVQMQTPKAATRDLALSQIKELYQEGLRTKLEINPFLVAFGYNATEIAALYDLWDWEKPISDRLPSRTDFDNFLAADVIDLLAWYDGYTALGYDIKYQEWYFAYLVTKGKIEG